MKDGVADFFHKKGENQILHLQKPHVQLTKLMEKEGTSHGNKKKKKGKMIHSPITSTYSFKLDITLSLI